MIHTCVDCIRHSCHWDGDVNHPECTLKHISLEKLTFEELVKKYNNCSDSYLEDDYYSNKGMD